MTRIYALGDHRERSDEVQLFNPINIVLCNFYFFFTTATSLCRKKADLWQLLATGYAVNSIQQRMRCAGALSGVPLLPPRLTFCA